MLIGVSSSMLCRRWLFVMVRWLVVAVCFLLAVTPAASASVPNVCSAVPDCVRQSRPRRQDRFALIHRHVDGTRMHLGREAHRQPSRATPPGVDDRLPRHRSTVETTAIEQDLHPVTGVKAAAYGGPEVMSVLGSQCGTAAWKWRSTSEGSRHPFSRQSESPTR